MIDRLPVLDIMPAWGIPKGDRYVSHPAVRTAMIQVMTDPTVVYVISDQKLPESIAEAVGMVEQWKVEDARTPF